MKSISRYILNFLAAAALLALTAAPAYAANFPMLTLSNSGTSVQIIVSNGDPNAPVLFYYPSGGSVTSVNIGNTNSSGYLTATINPGTYSISGGNPVYVNVDGEQSSSATWPNLTTANTSSASIYLTQTSLTLSIGQSTTVTASNITGSVVVSGNNNANVANTSVNGNSIAINGLAAGTSVLTVCDTGSGSCGSINVTVQPSYLVGNPVTLTPSNLNLGVGQTQTVTIGGYASGPYFISSNTGGNAISASVNNSNLVLTGLSTGTSNITVCSTSNQCGTTFINVVSNNTNTTTVTSSNAPLALASFTIASSNQNTAFLSGGNSIGITVNANQIVNNPIISVNGTSIIVNGSNSGPYTATYNVTGSESMPIPIVVSFTSPSGASITNYFWAGNSGAAPSVANPVTATPAAANGAQTSATLSSCPVGLTCVPVSTPTPIPSTTPVTSAGYQFTTYLYIDMTPQGTPNADVSALQQRLENDGFFSGAVTGYFGPVTKAAVIAYQAKHGLDQLGVVGPATRALLNQGI